MRGHAATRDLLIKVRGEFMMKYSAVCLLLLCAPVAFAAQDVAGAVKGTVTSIDRASKVVVVDTGDGAKHTFHYADDLAVHAGDDSKVAATDTFHGVGRGSKVAVHYTIDGGRETAHEIDRIGDGGLKVIHGTVTHVDRGSRRISVATADGTVETVHLTANATDDAAKATAKGAAKGVKVSVYYTEKAGEKTAHFIEKLG
jgi:hypothetical protein